MFDENAQLLRKRVSRARAPSRRLGGALAAWKAVSDRSWVDLVPCKQRRMLEVILGQQETLELGFAHTANSFRDQDVVL